MITSKYIIDKLNEGLKMFGEYNYYDKGADEVMDVSEIAEQLKPLPNDDIIRILKEVESNHKNPNPLLADIAMQLINIEPGKDTKMDDLGKDSFWEEYF